MKRLLVFAAALSTPLSGYAQGLPPAMMQNGNRLKAGFLSLNSQWQKRTGQPLITPSDLAGSQNKAGNNQGNGTETEEQKQKRQLDMELKKVQSGGDDFTPAKIGDRYKIPIGYIARATLELTANTDNPGPIKGMLTQPIYSIDRKHILFPAGSVIVGKMVGPTDGQNQAINNRGMFFPTHIVRPDGGAMHIAGQDLLDRYGVNGVGDKVNYHLLITLSAAIGVGAVESLPNLLSNLTQRKNTFNTMSSNGSQYVEQGAQTILQQYMSLRPTITVRAGRVPILIFFNHEQFAPEWRATDNLQFTNVDYKGASR